MSEFDNETADVSAVLDAYMYLDYQYKSKGKQEENLNEKQNEYLKIIGNKTEELTSLTEQLRDLSIGIDSERKIKKEILPDKALDESR